MLSKRNALWAMVVLLTCMPDEGRADMSAKSDVDKKVSEIAQKVSKIRGLKIKKDIVKGVMNQSDLKKRLLLRIHEDYTPEEIAAEELMMKRFGLFPSDQNYLDTVVSMLTEQIAGFYDPKESKLYLTQTMGAGEDIVLSHEIEHAIQDQHFDLEKFMTEKKDVGDESLARQALLEGDGTLLMFEFSGTLDYSKQKEPNTEILAQSFSAASIQMAKYPMALRESMIFPYQAGLRFVDYFRSKGGWELVDDVYEKTPQSTEHILHPEKYEKGEKPILLEVRKPKEFDSWHELAGNVSGEFALGLMLRGWGIPRKQAETAVDGWGGDRTVIWSKSKEERNAEQTIGVLKTVWDTQKDAVEFFEAATFGLEQWSSQKAHRRGEMQLSFKDMKRGQVASLRQLDKSVTLVLGCQPAWCEFIEKSVN